ncbi:MAG TPA: hypothetical protein VM261_11755 [Kofleriaceae bacterium]|nr:hypothetical protein [Kofleriaceae bacterium]
MSTELSKHRLRGCVLVGALGIFGCDGSIDDRTGGDADATPEQHELQRSSTASEPNANTGGDLVAPQLPPGGPLAGGATCDAVGRTVQIPLRMSSTRGHITTAGHAVYQGLLWSGWFHARNVDPDTRDTCEEEEQKRHRSEATIPVTLRCIPYTATPGGAVDATKPCQPQVDFGNPTFADPQGSRSFESRFSGRYLLRHVIRGARDNARWEPEYGNRTSSCLYLEDSNNWQGAHWCLTKTETLRSVAPMSPTDIDRGTRNFVVGLGAGFIHSLLNPQRWNVTFGGGWSGLSYGPASVGVQWNATPPERDESTGWLGYNYTVQCGTDGQPYLVSRDMVNAATGTTSLTYDWTAAQIESNRLCDDLMTRAQRAINDLRAHADLQGVAVLIQARARSRDIDCRAGVDQVAGLLRNAQARDRATARRAEYQARPDNAQVLAALDALLTWLRSAEGRYAPEAGLRDRWAAVDRAIANLDMLGRLQALRTLYTAGELATFDAALTSAISYLQGPGPHVQATVDARYQAVMDRLAELLRNRLCKTRALTALDHDRRRWETDLQNRAPYVALAAARFTAARTAIDVRGITCAQVDAHVAALEGHLANIWRHMRGELRVNTIRTLWEGRCRAANRQAFRDACDAVVQRMRGIEFADQAAITAAVDALSTRRQQLCEPPPAVLPAECDLPPVVVPVAPTNDMDGADGAGLDQVSDAEIEGLLSVDDIGAPDEADVVLAMMDQGSPTYAALMTGDMFGFYTYAIGTPSFDDTWYDGDLAAALAGLDISELVDAWEEGIDAAIDMEPPEEMCELGHDVDATSCSGVDTCAGDSCVAGGSCSDETCSATPTACDALEPMPPPGEPYPMPQTDTRIPE